MPSADTWSVDVKSSTVRTMWRLSIRDQKELRGATPDDGDTNPDVWIQKIKMDPDTGVWAPIEGPGASNSQHWCDRYYAGGVFTGQREYLQGGGLGSGSGAGFCDLDCGYGLGAAAWPFVARD